MASAEAMPFCCGGLKDFYRLRNPYGHDTVNRFTDAPFQPAPVVG